MPLTSARVPTRPRVPVPERCVAPASTGRRVQSVMRFVPLILALVGLVKWSLGSISGSTLVAAAGGCLVAWLLVVNRPSQAARR